MFPKKLRTVPTDTPIVPTQTLKLFIKFEKTYVDSILDRVYLAQQTKDCDYIIDDYTNYSGARKFDVYLIKTDSAEIAN